MKQRPFTVKICMVLIFLNALVWLALGVLIAFDLHPGLPDMSGMKTALAIISLVIAAGFLILVYFLNRHNRIAYYLLLGFFLFTTILTIFDDVGWVDIAFLFICLVPTVLLIKDRKWYSQVTAWAEGE